jgi:hypothetical protein
MHSTRNEHIELALNIAEDVVEAAIFDPARQ